MGPCYAWAPLTPVWSVLWAPVLYMAENTCIRVQILADGMHGDCHAFLGFLGFSGQQI